MIFWIRVSCILLGIVAASSRADSAGPPAPTWPMDAAARKKLDAQALAQKLPTLAEERVNLTGTVPAFLLTRLQLPAEVEARRSQLVHADLIKRERTAVVPASAARVLDRLAKAVPAFQKPADWRFTLTVIDRGDAAVETPGGGYIHITRGLVNRLLSDKLRGESALAFVLAREVAHTALGHCRRGWQAEALEEEARKGIELAIAPSVWRDLLETKVHCTGDYVQFLYSQNQEFRADLYAFHLCRNAGFDLDSAIDGMRQLAARGNTEDRVPLLRLKRLLLERDGKVDSESDFGLFSYDKTSTKLVRCRDKEVNVASRPIVFVHGLYGTGESWLPFLSHLADQKEFADRPMLVFRHPSNGSLARSGQFLHHEVSRVVGEPKQSTFICHSAGGLVFRWYAEKLGGGFDRAVILATPHQGSDLTSLKFLFDLLEFAGSLRLGGADGVARLLGEGRGEIGLDLHPDSLFLRYLGGDRKLAKRYHVYYGEGLGPVQALALEAGFAALRKQVEPGLLPFLPEGLLRRQAEALVRGLAVPAEFLRGDGVVSVTSGRLAGAASNTKLRLRHGAFRRDAEVMRRVQEVVK